MKEYKVKKEDLKGEIKDFPIEVVQKMVDSQVEQGFKADVTKFQICKKAGFIWYSSEDGQEFWESVIVDMDFDLFFEKYPKNNIMAQTEIYIYTKKRKSAILVGEAPCSSRGALYLWMSLSKKYIGCVLSLYDTNGVKKVWDLYNDKRLTRNERIVLESTFDRSSCKPSNIKELVDALREVNHTLLNDTGNLGIQADLIEKAATKYKDILCVAILATNTVCFAEMCKSKDDTWDIFEDVNNIENNFK